MNAMDWRVDIEIHKAAKWHSFSHAKMEESQKYKMNLMWLVGFGWWQQILEWRRKGALSHTCKRSHFHLTHFTLVWGLHHHHVVTHVLRYLLQDKRKISTCESLLDTSLCFSKTTFMTWYGSFFFFLLKLTLFTFFLSTL